MILDKCLYGCLYGCVCVCMCVCVCVSVCLGVCVSVRACVRKKLFYCKFHIYLVYVPPLFCVKLASLAFSDLPIISTNVPDIR